jgi:hypothetical protein
MFHFLFNLGDGEPDRDFPAYNIDQLLRNIESDEFCLCEVDEKDNYRTYSVNDSLFGTPPPLPVVLTNSDKTHPTNNNGHHHTNNNLTSSQRGMDREKDRGRRYEAESFAIPVMQQPPSRYSEDGSEAHRVPPNVLLNPSFFFFVSLLIRCFPPKLDGKLRDD